MENRLLKYFLIEWEEQSVIQAAELDMALNSTDLDLITLIVKNIVPPWYSSILAGLISGILVVVGSFVVTILNHRHENAKMLREERKEAYITFMTNHFMLSLNPPPDVAGAMDLIKYEESLATVSLIGSPRIISEMRAAKFMGLMKKRDSKSVVNLLLPLMAEELQGEDVYGIVETLLKTKGNSGNTAASQRRNGGE